MSAAAPLKGLECRGTSPVTVDEARDSEEDYVKRWAQDKAMNAFVKRLYQHQDQIEALIRHHLQLHNEEITIAPIEKSMYGTFNFCIPIHVKYSHTYQSFMFRCPMPQKLAEAQYAGTVNEKMGCEVGAYVWMQEKCPNIRIPYLYGFGFADGRYYTHETQRPWYARYPHAIRRYLYSLFQRPMLSRYTPHPAADIDFPISYMLLEYIGPDVGQMLSRTWNSFRNDPLRKRNLFRSISQIILSLAHIPQSCIGSFRFLESGVITLTNRPLTSSIISLENEDAERTIQSNQVYHSTEDFVADIYQLHDNAFISNPNAAYDDDECYSHMAARASLRAISHNFIKKERRNGPYFLQYTDLTRSNIFVDDDWNITCLLDLEWISALPVEMIRVPHWLSGCDLIDGLTGDNLTNFTAVRQEFMHQFIQEESKMKMEHDVSLTATINEGWTSKSVWFWHTVNTGSRTLYPIVDSYIYDSFTVSSGNVDKISGILSALWRRDSAIIVRKKRDDYSRYINEFEELVDKYGRPVAKLP
ncbi:hypothetical protein H0G86_011868 [Trichoderma simmonsii]|uniref:Aminoglycoside phosphotransferase domain-containing protein n=1 Tax=Trichoderma simmonsii TaxID=1491479 RepID=A0A8G0LSM2_9HYPO|nr:hypothetical protein H0G86_011868 [Trichoderma simmonsii]